MQRDILKQVYSALQERGYNPVGQLIGYILSEDPTYITTHNEARQLVSKIDRDRLLKDVVESCFKNRSCGNSVTPF